jgi:hypothetical protein
MALSITSLVDLTQAKDFLRIDRASSLHSEAEYVGVGNNSDKSFTLDHTPVEGSLRVYLDNVLKAQVTDYTISGAVITFISTPASSKPVTASYDYSASSDTFESYDDSTLELLIDAATKIAEDSVGRYFITREIVETHIGDGTQVLRLYRRPVVEVASVSIDGDPLTTWSERLTIGRIYTSGMWPRASEIIVTYTSGYGTTRATVQALLPNAVTAVLLILSDLWENRGDTVDSVSISGVGSASYKLPSRASKMLDPLRVDLC